MIGKKRPKVGKTDRRKEKGRSIQDSDRDGTVVPNMWLVRLDNEGLYVPVIDWLSDPIPVADWLRCCRSPTAVSSSGQGEYSKPGGDQGAIIFQVKASRTVPLFTDVSLFLKQLFHNNNEEGRLRFNGGCYRAQWLNQSQWKSVGCWKFLMSCSTKLYWPRVGCFVVSHLSFLYNIFRKRKYKNCSCNYLFFFSLKKNLDGLWGLI